MHDIICKSGHQRNKDTHVSSKMQGIQDIVLTFFAEISSFSPLPASFSSSSWISTCCVSRTGQKTQTLLLHWKTIFWKLTEIAFGAFFERQIRKCNLTGDFYSFVLASFCDDRDYFPPHLIRYKKWKLQDECLNQEIYWKYKRTSKFKWLPTDYNLTPLHAQTTLDHLSGLSVRLFNMEWLWWTTSADQAEWGWREVDLSIKFATCRPTWLSYHRKSFHALRLHNWGNWHIYWYPLHI